LIVKEYARSHEGRPLYAVLFLRLQIYQN
jgi:hypothetical protein